MPTTLTTVVDITPQRISVTQGGQPAATVTTSIKRGRIARYLKRFGVSAIVGLLAGWGTQFAFQQKMGGSIDKKKMNVLIVCLMTIAFLGLSFYENNMFKVRYKYSTDLKVTSELVTSTFRRNKFKIRALHGDKSEDYTVRYIDPQNFEIFADTDEQIFTTVNNKYYSFSEVNEPEEIGRFLPLLKYARVKIEIKGNQMQNKSDIIVLAATLSYLHGKLRPVHLLGGLKLLGMVVPLVFIIKKWGGMDRIIKRIKLDSEPKATGSSSQTTFSSL